MFNRNEEEDAVYEGMPDYEADSSRVEDALQPGGGVMRDEPRAARLNKGEEVVKAPLDSQEDLEAVDLSEYEDEEEEAEYYPDGRRIVYFQYVGRRDKSVTRYGTHFKGRTYKLPENKAKTVLEMKQPDNSAAYKEV